MAANLTQPQILAQGDYGDPIRAGLKSHSTHRDASNRILLYERLGLNKPGYWVDYGGKKKQQEDEGYTEPALNFPEYEPFDMKVKPNTYEVNPSSGRKNYKNMKTPPIQMGGGGGGGGAPKGGKPPALPYKTPYSIVTTTTSDVFFTMKKPTEAFTPQSMKAAESNFYNLSNAQRVEKVLYKESKAKVKTNTDRNKGKKVSSQSTEMQRQQFKQASVQMVQQRSYSPPMYASRSSGGMMNIG